MNPPASAARRTPAATGVHVEQIALLSLVAACAILQGACDPGTEAEPADGLGAGATDSAGIELLHLPDVGEWDMETAPVFPERAALIVGEGDDPDPRAKLFRVVTAHRLSSGDIRVVERGCRCAKLFDPEGRVATTYGGEGDGPGEFETISWASRGLGDSLVVVDRQRGTVFAADGEGLRTFPFQLPESFRLTRPVAMFEDGFMGLGETTVDWPEEDGLFDGIVYLLRFDLAGRRMADPIPLRGGTHWLGIMGYGPDGSPRKSLAPPPFRTVVEEGIAPGRFVTGGAEDWSVTVHGFDRGPERRLSVARARRPVTERMRTGYFESMAPSPALRAEAEELFSEAFPDSLPAVDLVVAGADGAVWMRHAVPNDFGDGPLPGYREPTRPWTVFGAGGQLLGDLEVPSEFRITETGSGYLLGVWTDGMGVETVRLFDFLY